MNKQIEKHSTSPSLLLRVRDPNDCDAWEQFLAIYTSIVRDYCFQRRLQAADIDDVVQNVMATVSKAIRTFEYDPTKGRFRAWLGTVAANKIKSFLAKQYRRKDVVSNETIAVSQNQCSDPDSEWVAIFSERIFRTACSRIRHHFEDDTWECFEATWVRNEPATKVAKSINIPTHSVYVNKSRVLKRLETEVRMLAEDVPIASASSKK